MVHTRSLANFYLAALVLALVLGYGACAQAAEQGPQAPAGVEQSDEGLTGGAEADPSEPDDVIEPDEIEPDAIGMQDVDGRAGPA